MQLSTQTKAQELPKTSDSLLHLLIDSLPAFISYIDSNQRYVLANRLSKEFFGSKFTFVEGLHVRQVIGEAAYQTIRPHIEAALRGERQSYEYELQNRGETHHLKSIYVPDAEKGRVKGIFVLGIDITELRQAEQELRSAKEQLEHVIESNPAVIWVGKPLPDLSDSYSTYQSKSTVSMTGFESQELMGEKGAAFWQSRVHPDDLTSYRAGMPELWTKGHRACEYRFRHKDGTYRWIREEANVIRDSAGKVQDIVGYWTDVTERRLMEEKLMRSNRLATIGQTAAMVGHDLRNPLQAMTGTVYLMKELAASENAEDKKEAIALLDTLDDKVRYMDKIVSDLQDYARPVGADLVRTNLLELVRASVANVKIPGNIKVTENFRDDVSSLMLDPVLFRRVLTNLLLNAVQAMPNGGDLAISARKTQDTVAVTVQDTGSGISTENLTKIFNPFFTTKAQGQGLGLAVCKRLIEAHGGTIEVTSELKNGSAFTLKIPTNRNVMS